MAVAAAPSQEAPKEDAVQDVIRRARGQGAEVVHNADGSITIIPNKLFRSGL